MFDVLENLHKKIAATFKSGKFANLISRCSFKFRTNINLFWIKLFYYVSISLLGTVALLLLHPSDPSYGPNFLDMLFMSTSAATITGLTVVEMSVFSSAQIFVLTLLMLLGGEVFTNLLSILLKRARYRNQIDNDTSSSSRFDSVSIEMEPNPNMSADLKSIRRDLALPPDEKILYRRSLRYLSIIIWSYFVIIHTVFLLSFFAYLSLVSSAKQALQVRGINPFLFSLNLSVSSFANGGIINEDMNVFNKNTGLLLLVIPEALIGNTLFPVVLTIIVTVLKKFSKRADMVYLLDRSREFDFSQLVSLKEAFHLFATVIGFIVVEVAFLCALDWDSQVFTGLSSYQKLVNALFVAVNSRYTGSASLDLSLISPAVLVLFIVMMYLPGSTSFVPINQKMQNKTTKQRSRIMQNFLFSQLSYLSIFVIIICVIERKKIARDPLNYSVFNVVFETMSAYANLGFSNGYSCSKQLLPDGKCQEKSYSFSGNWSNEGKIVLGFVMLFGRLKKFNMKGGKAWKLS